MGKVKSKKNLLRLTKRLCFWLLIVMTLVVVAFLIADTYLKGSLSFFIINALINHQIGQLIIKLGTDLVIPMMQSNNFWINSLIIIIPIALIIFNASVIKRLKFKESVKHVMHLIIYFCLAIFLIGFTVSQVYVDYSIRIVNTFLLDEHTMNLEKSPDFNAMQKTVKQSKAVAQNVIDTVILEFKADKDALSNLETGHYMEVAETIALCFQIKGSVLSKSEHYLRNAFERAPKDLETMIQDIKNKTPYGWRLLEQWETVYHMQGENGEYNVKFVSEDGYHEAIYNKAGVLLTEKNDPVNMGTFNYADPTGQPAMHATLDVLPYYNYGNCSVSPKSSKENNAYQNNPDAQKYWENLKLKLSAQSE